MSKEYKLEDLYWACYYEDDILSLKPIVINEEKTKFKFIDRSNLYYHIGHVRNIRLAIKSKVGNMDGCNNVIDSPSMMFAYVSNARPYDITKLQKSFLVGTKHSNMIDTKKIREYCKTKIVKEEELEKLTKLFTKHYDLYQKRQEREQKRKEMIEDESNSFTL